MQKACQGFLCKSSATLFEVGLYLLREMVKCPDHAGECRWRTVRGLLLVSLFTTMGVSITSSKNCTCVFPKIFSQPALWVHACVPQVEGQQHCRWTSLAALPLNSLEREGILELHLRCFNSLLGLLDGRHLSLRAHRKDVHCSRFVVFSLSSARLWNLLSLLNKNIGLLFTGFRCSVCCRRTSRSV